MPPIVKYIAVHYCNRTGRGQAALFVPYTTAVEMVEARLAIWSKGAKYLNLTKSEAQMPPTARSIKMGPDVMFSCACGNTDDIALRDAYCPADRKYLKAA